MSTDRILKNLKANQHQVERVKALIVERDKQIKKLPADAQKFYNDQTKDLYKAFGSGNNDTAKDLGEKLQNKMHKMNGKNAG